MKRRDKKQHNIILGVMIFVILIFSSSIILYKNVLDNIEYTAKKTTEYFKKEQFKVLWSDLKSFQSQADEEVTQISLSIEEDIANLSEDELEEVRVHLTNGTNSEVLHEILINNIEGKNLNGINNHKNGIFVITTRGYLEDYNYRRISISSSEDEEQKTLQYGIDNSYNKELDTDAINKLLNRSNNIIAFESYNITKNEDHIKIKELNYETLSKVFIAEGINGLRNYQILVPFYITDIGDIFGEPDSIQGVKNENNKIIVIQEFNLYDQLINSKDSEIFTSEVIDNLRVKYNTILSWLYAFGITLVMGTCGLILYFCTIYNNILASYEMYRYYDEHLDDDEECECLDE